MSAAVVVLLSGFYLYERRFQIERVDLELSLPQPALISSHLVLPQAEARARNLTRRLSTWQGPDEDGPEGRKPERRSGARPSRSQARSRIRSEKNESRSPSRTEIDILTQHGLYAKVWNRQGRVVFSHGPKDIEILEPPRELLVQDGRSFRWNGSNRELVFVGRQGALMIIGRDGASIHREMADFAWKLAGIGAGILGLAFWLGWLSSGQVIRPIEQISRMAHRIAGGDLSERISESDADPELEELVRVLNATFARLSDSLERQIKFSLDASHELRTPLAIIFNECQWVLEETRSPEEYKTSVTLCEKMARHMRGLIEALLELSRVDAHASPLQLTSLPLSVIFEDARGLLEGLASRENVRLEFAPLDVVLMVDPGKIKQIIMNLVINAIEHSPTGGTVRIEGHMEVNRVAIDVIDEGEGIAPEELERIFGRFYRVDPNRSRLRGGSGLGLAISLGIASAHGGALRVRSTEGKGSCFTLQLPLQEDTERLAE